MTTKLWRNRKERKDWARRLRSEDPGLEVVHPHAAGIDVGNSAHYVAVRPDRDPEPVRRFECFTADLYRLAEWLVLLCYKKGAPQKGQPESCRSRIRAMVCRSVAMDQGLCRSARTGRTPRVESRRHFGDG